MEGPGRAQLEALCLPREVWTWPNWENMLILNVLGLEINSWDDSTMILHGLCWGRSKDMVKNKDASFDINSEF